MQDHTSQKAKEAVIQALAEVTGEAMCGMACNGEAYARGEEEMA